MQTSDARAPRRATTQAARKAAAQNGCPDKPELLLHRARGGAARHQALSSVYSKSLSDVIGTAPRAVLETRWRAGASARCY